MPKSYNDLKVWNRAMDLTVVIYEFTADLPKAELYGLTSQMRRAAVSIASNIAEGSARSSRKDFRQFIQIARGSTCELLTQLAITSRLKIGIDEKRREAELLANEVGKMLSGLSSYLARPKIPPTNN